MSNQTQTKQVTKLLTTVEPGIRAPERTVHPTTLQTDHLFAAVQVVRINFAPSSTRFVMTHCCVIYFQRQES
jgi:hypothetical protein